MWESHAAFLRDFSKPLREATRFVAFLGGVISTAGLFFFAGNLLFATIRRGIPRKGKENAVICFAPLCLCARNCFGQLVVLSTKCLLNLSRRIERTKQKLMFEID